MGQRVRGAPIPSRPIHLAASPAWCLDGPSSDLGLCLGSGKAPAEKSEEARIKPSVTIQRLSWERRNAAELGWPLVASPLNAKVMATPSLHLEKAVKKRNHKMVKCCLVLTSFHSAR